MNPKLRKILQFILFFGLGIGLMWWQYSRFTPEQQTNFLTGLRNANYFWFAVAVFIGALAHLSRAIRWQQLLHPLGRKAGLGNRFYAVMIGYLANYGLPRSGEVIRCGLLKGSDDVPFSEAVGTVIVERIVDMLCLLIVFLLVFIMEFSQLESLWVKYIWIPAGEKFNGLLQNKMLLIILIAGFVLAVAAFWVLRKKIKSKVTGKFSSFLKGIKDGILAVRRVPQPGWFIFHSLFIWAGYLFSLYFCFYCFPVTSGQSINTALILLLFGTFGVIFTPGGIGLYQVIVTGVLLYLMTNGQHTTVTEDAIAPFAWLSWGAQVATVLLFTGIAALIRPVLNREKK